MSVEDTYKERLQRELSGLIRVLKVIVRVIIYPLLPWIRNISTRKMIYTNLVGWIELMIITLIAGNYAGWNGKVLSILVFAYMWVTILTTDYTDWRYRKERYGDGDD